MIECHKTGCKNLETRCVECNRMACSSTIEVNEGNAIPTNPLEITGDDSFLLSFKEGKLLIEPNWIKCSDRLPEEGVTVLTLHCTSPGWDTYELDYIIQFGDEFIWANLLQDDKHKVTHWMPLPKRPENE